MGYTKDDLEEARRQLDSLLHKLRETVKTLAGKENAERYRSQITLAQRRIKALELAGQLIEKERAHWEDPCRPGSCASAGANGETGDTVEVRRNEEQEVRV